MDGINVTYFPVDDRDVRRFLRVQEIISRDRPVSSEEERLWLANGVQSTPLCDYLREHADRFDRILLGPYLFGLVHSAAAVCPSKSLLIPCLHDEPFARLQAVHRLFRSVAGILFNSIPEQELARRLIPDLACPMSVVGMGLTRFPRPSPDAPASLPLRMFSTAGGENLSRARRCFSTTLQPSGRAPAATSGSSSREPGPWIFRRPWRLPSWILVLSRNPPNSRSCPTRSPFATRPPTRAWALSFWNPGWQALRSSSAAESRSPVPLRAIRRRAVVRIIRSSRRNSSSCSIVLPFVTPWRRPATPTFERNTHGIALKNAFSRRSIPEQTPLPGLA